MFKWFSAQAQVIEKSTFMDIFKMMSWVAVASSLVCLARTEDVLCNGQRCTFEEQSLLSLKRGKRGKLTAEDLHSMIYTKEDPLYNPDGSENKLLSQARAAYGRFILNRSLALLQAGQQQEVRQTWPWDSTDEPKNTSWEHVAGTDSAAMDPTANPIAFPPEVENVLGAINVKPILGDPSVVLIDDYIHMWSNTIVTGIKHYTAPKDRPWDMKEVGTSIHYPGSIRPYAHFDKEKRKLILFYEQMSLIANPTSQGAQMPYDSGTMQQCEADVDGPLAFWFGKSTLVLEPMKDSWESSSQSRIGNTYVHYDKNASKWRLFYSANKIWIPDSEIAEPRALGVAESDSIYGPWKRINDDKPIELDGHDCWSDNSKGKDLCDYTMPGTNLTVIGHGSCKLIDVDNSGGNDFGLSICNRLTSDPARKEKYPDKYTGSTISLMQQNGLGFVTTMPEFVGPSLIEGDWKEAYAYGYDTIPDPSDPESLLVYYNGRDGWKGKGEVMGMTKIPVSSIPGYTEHCGKTCVDSPAP